MNSNWEGHYINSSDSNLIHQISWEYALDSAYVKQTKEVPELNFRMETFYYWDYEMNQISTLSLLNRNMYSKGKAQFVDNKLELTSKTFNTRGASNSRQTFEITESGTLQDFFYRKVAGEWMQGHLIEYLKNPKSIQLSTFPTLNGPYLGQNPPGKVAEQFAPGIITTDLHDDASPAFSPDLKEIYFRIVYKIQEKYFSTIFYSKENKDGWTLPEVDIHSGKTLNGGTYISKDGKRKYVRVNKEVYGRANLDLALSLKQDDGWNAPEELTHLNSEFNEGSVFESEGYLYWWTETRRNDPKPKLFRSKISDGFILKEQVTHFPDSALIDYINEDEGYALMTMKSRLGSYDIFVSFKDKNGIWQEPINLGEAVNSNSTEKAASVSPDGKYLFFVSSRKENLNPKRIWDHPFFKEEEPIWKADIYWVDAQVIMDLKK